MARHSQMTRRTRLRRRRAAALTILVAIVLVTTLVVTHSGGSTTSSAPHRRAASRITVTKSAGPASLEAGVEPWQLPSPISREAVVANGKGLTILGGITPSGSSVSGVFTLDPINGTVTAAGSLPNPVHDAAAATLGATTFDFGGGSPNTVATVQSIRSPSIPPGGVATGQAPSQLPEPRSDLAVTTIGSSGDAKSKTVAYIVGGYNGVSYLGKVLATTDGTQFTSVATLKVPVRYSAVASFGGQIYTFGGETASASSNVTATNDIQMVDPATHTATIVGHLPRALYGAAAFVINGTIYVAGGQIPGGSTLTRIYAFEPNGAKVLDAGLLPQAEAFGGYATVGTGASAIGYIVGGEVASQSGTDQAGIPSGTLQTVLSLRPSPYGGPAGGPSAGSPFSGTLLMADRGNNRLIAINAARSITWQYPSATAPPPPGGFYFPDDAFFFDHGHGIISNQENNHTIVEIGYPSGKLLWQYGHPGVPGSLPGYLDQPDDAYMLKSGVVTVADASNNRILFINPAKQILGQIGNGIDAHVPNQSLAYPNGDTPLANGNVLISEINGSWISEYTPAGKMVWTVQLPSVNYPSDPQQLGPDLYLLADYNPNGEGRILEFNRAGQILWRYDVTAGDGMLRRPSLAERLPNGLIMLNDDYNDRVVVIDPKTNSIVWQYGLTATAGTAPGMLKIPDGFDILLANGTTPTHPQTG
ncbi:MAG: outer membrane protein assembly factor BamB family protein [Acidimicrobiales bacterium]